MDRLEQLFMEEKFHLLDPEMPPISELLALPLNKNLQKKKRKHKSMFSSFILLQF